MQPENRPTALAILIVGAGNIASKWDEGAPAALPKTHIGAFKLLPEVGRIALVEPDSASRQRACSFWGITDSYPELPAIKGVSFDVACLCTPTSVRASAIKELVRLKVPTIVCEKPIAQDLHEAEELQRTLVGSGTNLLVNYSRSFAPGIRKLKGIITSGGLGHLVHGSAVYGKGVLNNGSHMVNLVNFLVGDTKHIVNSTTVRDGREDSGDPTRSFVLASPNGALVHVLGTDHGNYSIFELDLLFEKGRVQLLDGGAKIKLWKVCKDPLYPGYQALGPDQEFEGRTEESMVEMAKEAVALARGEQKVPSCGLKEGLDALRICSLALKHK